MKSHSLMVANCISKLEAATERKQAKIEFTLSFPRYLKTATNEGNRLVSKLLSQEFGDIKIKGLTLTWNEEEDESTDE